MPNNNNSKVGQMTWRPDGRMSSGKLHLRFKPWERWKPYTEFPEYIVSDLPGFSEGYGTCLKLLKQKWELI
jgi:hypothetical protein